MLAKGRVGSGPPNTFHCCLPAISGHYGYYVKVYTHPSAETPATCLWDHAKCCQTGYSPSLFRHVWWTTILKNEPPSPSDKSWTIYSTFSLQCDILSLEAHFNTPQEHLTNTERKQTTSSGLITSKSNHTDTYRIRQHFFLLQAQFSKLTAYETFRVVHPVGSQSWLGYFQIWINYKWLVPVLFLKVVTFFTILLSVCVTLTKIAAKTQL